MEFMIYDLRFMIGESRAAADGAWSQIVNRKSEIGNQNGALTWICTTNLRLRRAACRTNYTLRALLVDSGELMVDRKNRRRRRVLPLHQLSTIHHQLSLASVIGLAPIRPGLKDRLLELLCIHGLLAQSDWSPRLVSHQRLLGFNEALICLSYSGVAGME
jgi:hypothetical protein